MIFARAAAARSHFLKIVAWSFPLFPRAAAYDDY